MSLRHSYKAEVHRLNWVLKRLELQLLSDQNNEAVLSKKERIQEEMEWYTNQIREGKDPGVHIV